MAKKKCQYCGRWFIPDPRVVKRQRACSIECQRVRKRQYNRLYRLRHPECWKDHYRDYVKPWRQRHPDYQRQWRQKRKALGEGGLCEIKVERLRQLIEFIERIYFYLCEIKAEISLWGLVIPTRGRSFGFSGL